MSELLISSSVGEIWVHATCTTFPQEDTVWIMFSYQPYGGEVQYSPAMRYEIGMRVKNNKHPNGGELPYTRFHEWKVKVNNSFGGRYGLLLINKADRPQGEIEAHMKNLFRSFDASAVASFGSSGAPTAPHPALRLVDIVVNNISNFNLVSLATQTGQLIIDTYFKNKDAPVAYDRVERAAGDHGKMERYARDYIGDRSRYGVAWKVGQA